MSKVVKGIKKVFKKVVKVVKKIAPVVLAAAAIYFTAGAAMGVGGPTAGSALASSMGLTGTLGGVVSGAVTQAGYGALIGGTLSKAQGGSFSEGAKAGALGGMVTGGISGGINPAGAGVTPAAPTSGIDPGALNAADEAASMGANFSHDAGISPVSTATPPSVAAAPQAATSKGLLNQGGWLERNQALVGNVVGGIGQGMMARSQADSEIDALRERQKIINENYSGVKPSAGFNSLAPGTGQRRPMDRPDTYSNYEFQYNPQSGRIERVNLS